MTEVKNTTAPLKVFCSYSHQDEKELGALRKHLRSLSLSGLIEDWHDRKIPPGGDWDAEIRHNLDTADLILLLISADFVSSEYCMQKETARALQWHEAGEATVIPVFLRECVIGGLPFERIQGTPRDVKWINQQQFPDKAWTEVTQAVQAAAFQRLGVSSWPTASASQVDAWSIPVGLEGRSAGNSDTPLDYGQIQTAFGGAASSRHASLDSQSGHAYVATDSDDVNPSFVRTGFLVLLAIVAALAVAGFSWSQWFSKPDKAYSVVKQNIITPENNTRLGVAKMYLQQGEYKKAHDTCQLAVESPFKVECLTLTGLALKEVNDSKLYLAEVEEVDTAFSEVLLGEFRLADFDGSNADTLGLAEQHFARALQKDASLASVYFGRGQIQHFQGNMKAALPLYKKALKLAPDNGRFALNRAAALADAGKLELARVQLEEVLAVKGEVLLAHAELIEVLVNQDKRPEAQKAASALQILLLSRRGSEVVCDPVNTVEWVVLQDSLPAFISSWASAGVASWGEKRAYLNYIISLAAVPPVKLPIIDVKYDKMKRVCDADAILEFIK